MNDNPAGIGTRDLKIRIRALEAALREPGSKDLIPSAELRKELSNIIGTPTEEEMEDIDPTLVTEALRKVPQALTPEEQAQVKANLNISKMELFDDMWRAAVGIWGDIDHSHVEDGKLVPYMCNEIWMDYDEAVRTYYLCAGWHRHVAANHARGKLSLNCNVRTALPIYYASGNPELNLHGLAQYNESIEVIRFVDNAMNNACTAMRYSFYGCAKLHAIHGKIILARAALLDCAFDFCWKLETVWLYNVCIRADFRHCPKLSLDSVAYMVQYAKTHPDGGSPTDPVEITVHPKVYAKLTDETNTEWHQVLIDAAAKNITFATV